MVSRELLHDMVGAVTKARGKTVETAALQRQTRVGFNTAHQLAEAAEALEVAGVLGGLEDRRRKILARKDAAHWMVAEAIVAGRIVLTGEEVAQ